MPKRTTTARKPRSQSKAVTQKSTTLKAGDRVRLTWEGDRPSRLATLEEGECGELVEIQPAPTKNLPAQYKVHFDCGIQIWVIGSDLELLPAQDKSEKTFEPEIGELVYFESDPQKIWEVLQVEGDDVWLENPLLPGSSFRSAISRLKPWEFKYYPGQWVKVKGAFYPRYIFEVRHFKTEPDDGLRYYNTKLAGWLDDVVVIGQSQIEYAVLEPEWVNLYKDDRVVKYVFSGAVNLAGTIESIDDDLIAKVQPDLGEMIRIDIRELEPLPLFFRIGDRVTEDINTENAYKEGWASEQNRTHGTIASFKKSGGKFYPQIRTADGALHMANPACLQPCAGGAALPEPEPTEPPITAEQVIEEMERAMGGELESASIEKSDSLSDDSTPSVAVEVLPSDNQIEQLYQDLIAAEKQADEAIASTTQKYFNLGQALLQVRGNFKRGEWLPWLQQRGIQERRAQRSIQIAKHFAEKSDSLSLFSIEAALGEAQKKLAPVFEHSFEEVAALYASLPETEFFKHRNGSFNYAVKSCGYVRLYRSPDEAFEQFEWHRERVERYLERNDEATTEENPAPTEYGLKPKPTATPTLDPPPQTKSTIRFQRGDRVSILADDDLRNCTAIVERTFDVNGLQYAAIYCSDLPGFCLEYLLGDLSFVAGSTPSSLAELEKLVIPPVELTPQPEVREPEPVAEPLRLQISDEQRAAEKLLAEYRVPIPAVAKKLLSWCDDKTLEEISEWLLDEKARRKGYANYEEFADAVQAQFFEKEAS